VNATDEVVEGWFPTPADYGISLNGKRIAYTINNNLYVNQPETNYVKKITEYPYNAVSKVTKFGAGWFTCEDQVVTCDLTWFYNVPVSKVSPSNHFLFLCGL